MARARTIGEALRDAGISEVFDDTTTRALYSSDASLYRVPPQAVVRPREIDEVGTVLEVCRRHGVPLTSRGGGTSVAGNAVGPGVVLDFARHLGRVLRIDPEARTATVQPGVVQSELQRAAAPYGLRFGPDPSTHNRCTVGGMIGNNACGARTLGYGRTSDNVLGLEVLTGAGRHLSLPDDAPVLESLRRITLDHLATIRTEFGRFGRQASGYALEHLLPENGFDVLRFFVGSEGTLGVVTEATVRLVADPAVRVLVALGYPDIATAGDAAHTLLGFGPTACEGLDSRIVDVVRARRGAAAVPPLPRGGGVVVRRTVRRRRRRGPGTGAIRRTRCGGDGFTDRDRPRQGRAAVAHPRGRGGTGRAQPRRAARPLRLGGRRRPAGTDGGSTCASSSRCCPGTA